MYQHTNTKLTNKLRELGFEPRNGKRFHFSEIDLEKLGLGGRENYFNGIVKTGYWQEWLLKWL